MRTMLLVDAKTGRAVNRVVVPDDDRWEPPEGLVLADDDVERWRAEAPRPEPVVDPVEQKLRVIAEALAEAEPTVRDRLVETGLLAAAEVADARLP